MSLGSVLQACIRLLQYRHHLTRRSSPTRGFMRNELIAEIFMQEALGPLSADYGFNCDTVTAFPGTEGSANLVYEYAGKDGPAILRISYRPDRSTPQIQAELDFIGHLATNGVRVATPIASLRGELIETLQTSAGTLNVVAFRKGAGSRVPDNGYRYRDDAPIEEYFRNWGQALGRMHAAARTFLPLRPWGRNPYDVRSAKKPSLFATSG